MRKLSTLLFPLMIVVTLTSTPALAEWSAKPPAEWTGNAAEWEELFGRAKHFSEAIKKVNPKANVKCLMSMLVGNLLHTEIQGRTFADPGQFETVNVTKKDAPALRSRVAKENDSACNEGGPGPNAPVYTLKAYAEFIRANENWDTDNWRPGTKAEFDIPKVKRLAGATDLNPALGYLYSLAKKHLKATDNNVETASPPVVYLLQAGILVPAVVEGAGAAAAAVLVPILSPELATKKKHDPRDGM